MLIEVEVREEAVDFRDAAGDFEANAEVEGEVAANAPVVLEEHPLVSEAIATDGTAEALAVENGDPCWNCSKLAKV